MLYVYIYIYHQMFIEYVYIHIHFGKLQVFWEVFWEASRCPEEMIDA